MFQTVFLVLPAEDQRVPAPRQVKHNNLMYDAI